MPISAMVATPDRPWRMPRAGRIVRLPRGYRLKVNGIDKESAPVLFQRDDVLEFEPFLHLPGTPPLYLEWA